MKHIVSKTYREYQDSSEEEQTQVKEQDRQEIYQQQMIQSMDREGLIELLLGTRRQVKYYINLQKQSDRKLHEMTQLYQQCLDKLLKSHKTQKDVNKAAMKLTQNKQNFDINLVSRTKKLSGKKNEQFRQKICCIVDGRGQEECIQKIEILKQAGKFVCSLYKMIDDYTSGEYFRGEYLLSNLWGLLKELLDKKYEKEYNKKVCEISGYFNCRQQQIWDRIQKQCKQVRHLRGLIELIQKKHGNILTQIYLSAKRSTKESQ